MPGVAIGSWTWDTDSQELRRGEARLQLTVLERDLLAFLADNPGVTVSRAELLRHVWSYSPKARTRAVANAVARLRAKLGDDASSLVTVYAKGYRLEIHTDTDLVGRQREVVAIREALQIHRFVTLYGLGGVGKTRLARSMRHRSQGTLWVGVGSMTMQQEVICAVAGALEVGAEAATAEGIGAALQGLGRVLLVLDEAEQVGDGLLQLVDLWLARAPDIQVLLTSRVVHGDGPCVHVAPLDAASAAELFRQRVELVRPGLTFDEAQLASTLAPLEGLPLALELAAARMRVLDLDELHRRLDARLELLRDRTKSMEAVLRTTWDLLDTPEQRVLSAGALFPTGFTLQEVEHVAGFDAVDPLEALARASLVVRDGSRFRLLEMVRHFAEQRAPKAFLTPFVSWAVTRADVHNERYYAHGPSSLDVFRDEAPALREALRLAHVPAERARLVLAIDLHDRAFGPARDLYEDLHALPLDELPVELAAEVAMARAFEKHHGEGDALELATAALAWARRTDSPDRVARAWLILVPEQWLRHGAAEALEEAQHLVQYVLQHTVRPRTKALSLRELALWHLQLNQLQPAREWLLKSLACVEAGDLGTQSQVVRGLAMLYERLGQPSEGVKVLEETYQELLQHEDWSRAPRSLAISFGGTLLDAGQVERGREILEREVARARAAGDVQQALLAELVLVETEPDPDKAERITVRIREQAQRVGRTDLVGIAEFNIGAMRHVRGELQAAETCYDHALQLSAGRDELVHTVVSAWRALIVAERGQREEAAAALAAHASAAGLAASVVALCRAVLSGPEAWEQAKRQTAPHPLTDRTQQLCERLA
ncbi:MAG: winged helix-turn-helix domain-containing protein [Myxococcales bacterium]|nr:winged helix-turn-helix domain-containing protein [Myxococcales bacterium]